MASEDIIVIIVTGSYMMGLLCIAIVFFVLYYMKGRKLHLEKLQTEILRTELETIDKTSIHISRELHDHVAQHLSVACILLQENELKGEALKKTHRLVDDAVEELRKLSRVLTAHHVQETDLAEALKQELSLYSDLKNCRLELKISEEGIDLDAEKQLMLLRIAQEAVGNAVKHSGASRISLNLDKTEEKYRLLVSDNGKGFDINATDKANGLHNIRQRAEFIGAELHIRSEPGKGTEIEVLI